MSYMKKPCQHCPFRNDVKPFLHPERATDLAYASQNLYSSFSCHKTLEYDEEGETYAGEESKECAGFLTLRAQAGERIPEGFEPSWEICYIDPHEMSDAYAEAWEER